MKELVLVEFIALGNDRLTLIDKLLALDEEFRIDLGEPMLSHEVVYSGASNIYSVAGVMNAACATMIKLRDPYLADHMRISEIPEHLKDKYRQ